MTLPDNNRKPPAGTGGNSESDQLAGDQFNVNDSADAHAVVAAAWQSLAGLILSAPPLELAGELLDGLPPAPDPVLDWWICGARLCVDAGSVPMVLAAADAAIRAGVKVPPGMRGLVLATGSKMVSDVTGTPMVCGRDLVRIIKSGHIRNAVEMNGNRLSAAAWRGDDDALAEFIKAEAGALVLLAERVIGNV